MQNIINNFKINNNKVSGMCVKLNEDFFKNSEKFAKLFSENCDGLENYLNLLYSNSIKTRACCAGHKQTQIKDVNTPQFWQNGCYVMVQLENNKFAENFINFHVQKIKELNKKLNNYYIIASVQNFKNLKSDCVNINGKIESANNYNILGISFKFGNKTKLSYENFYKMHEQFKNQFFENLVNITMQFLKTENFESYNLNNYYLLINAATKKLNKVSKCVVNLSYVQFISYDNLKLKRIKNKENNKNVRIKSKNFNNFISLKKFVSKIN